MTAKICLLLCFLACEVTVAGAFCPTVTREMARSCVTYDRKCSATPRLINNCFDGCDIACSDTEDENRCGNPTDLNMCDIENGDPHCKALADFEEVNGNRCFRRCNMICRNK